MSWRGQGGRRAKGRRGDQDPELDNTAWLAELEREAAAQPDDDEDDWASTLRGRRPPAPSPSTPAPPPQPPPEPDWAPPSGHHHQANEPGGGGSGYGPVGSGSGGAGSGQGSGAWGADPNPQDLSPAPDPDWSWRSPDVDAFGEQGSSTQADPDPGWDRYGATARSDPVPEAFGGAQQDAGAGWEGSQPGHRGWGDPGDPDERGTGVGNRGWGDPGDRDNRGAGAGTHEWGDPGDDRGSGSDPGVGADLYGAGDAEAAGGSSAHGDHGGWQSAGVETPTGPWDAAEPVGREPDYPALFGELYRRSASQQDPIWEAPPAVEPMPEQGQPDPPGAAWPFEETTQSWEPSDRSFIWPSDELPSTQQAEWDRPGSTNWLDDPAPRPAVPPEPDQTAAWPGPGLESGRRAWEEPAPEPGPGPGHSPWASQPEPRPSPWGSQPGVGNGVAPPMPPPTGPTTPAPAPPAGSVGPPPDDWAAAIPTDVPAARRAADPSATRVWRPDDGADAEPGVPLGPGSRDRAPGPQAPPGERPGGRATRPRGPAGGAPPGEGLAGPAGTPGAPAGAGLGAPFDGSPGAPTARGGPPGGTGVAGGTARRRRQAPARDAEAGATAFANGDPGTRTAPRGRTSSEAAWESDAALGMSPIDTGKDRRNRTGGDRKGGDRQDGERQARAWPRVVAVISWIVLVMVLCWYYVFPWLERVLPENF